MSLTAVRSYFRSRMDGLGFTEWTDGFEFEEIPETVIDRTYHLTSEAISLNSATQTVNDLNYPVTVRLYLKGFRNPATAIDDSIFEGERIVCDVTKVENANAEGVKDVQVVSLEPIPKDETNDNIVLLVMVFNARVILDRR